MGMEEKCVLKAFAEKDLGFLVGCKLSTSQQRTFTAKQANSTLRSMRRSTARRWREVILPLQLSTGKATPGVLGPALGSQFLSQFLFFCYISQLASSILLSQTDFYVVQTDIVNYSLQIFPLYFFN